MTNKKRSNGLRQAYFLLLTCLLLVVMFMPQKVTGQEGGEQPAGGQPSSADPGPAGAADLVIDDPNADLQAAIAEVAGISPQALASPVIFSPAAFLDTNFNSDFRFTFNGYLYSTGSVGTSVCAGAPLDLPTGAIINGVTAYAYDNDAAQNIGFWLFAKNYKSTTAPITSASFDSTGANTLVRSFTDLTITQPTVDNSTYTYFVYVCLRSPNHRLYAMQVNFTLPPTFLPVTLKDN